MVIEETKLEGCFVISPKIFKDNRGEFFESYNKELFKELTGQEIDFVQDNQSISKKGVLRGLHFQEGKYAQAKLVRAVQGSILDICVDFRRKSKTFGEYFSITLDSKENKQIFVPKGFAHGFVALSDKVILNYKCDNFYNKASEKGIIYNDPTLNINWHIADDQLILSEKDKALPTFKAIFQ